MVGVCRVLRIEIARMHASTCVAESALQAEGETVVLQQQLNFRERTFTACQQSLQNASQTTAKRNADCDCKDALKVTNLPPFHPKRIREVLDWESFDRGYVYSWRRYWRVNGHMGIMTLTST